MKLSRILAAVLGAAVGLLPAAPPEHVHEAEEQGHAHAVIHRHLKPHGLLDRHAEPHQAFGDDDGPAFTLTTDYYVPAPLVIPSPERIVSAWVEPPAPRRFERPFADVDTLIHGPPRAPTPLRGPPFPPAT